MAAARQEPDVLDAAAVELRRALTGSLLRELRRQDSVALAYSGGLDSTVLAALLVELADVDVFLVAVGLPGSRDLERARRNARFFQLPLVEAPVTPRMIERDLATITRLVGRTPVPQRLRDRHALADDAQRVSPVLVAVQTAFYYAFREAGVHARRVLLGQGADELMGGYQRYLGMDADARTARMRQDLAALQDVARPIEARVAAQHDVEARYPYLEPGVQAACHAMPPEALVHAGERKRVLRRLADTLGLPADIVHVPKTAAQYGTGISALLRRMAQQAGQPQHRFLESFLEVPEAGTGSPNVDASR